MYAWIRQMFSSNMIYRLSPLCSPGGSTFLVRLSYHFCTYNLYNCKQLFLRCHWSSNLAQCWGCCRRTTLSCRVSTLLAEQWTCGHWWTVSDVQYLRIYHHHRHHQVWLRRCWGLICCDWLLRLASLPSSCWSRFAIICILSITACCSNQEVFLSLFCLMAGLWQSLLPAASIYE